MVCFVVAIVVYMACERERGKKDGRGGWEEKSVVAGDANLLIDVR